MEQLETITASTQNTLAFDMPERVAVQFKSVQAPSIQTGTRAARTLEAVHNYIFALKSLGKTRVNTREIATALELPRALVEQAIKELREEGVKLIK